MYEIEVKIKHLELVQNVISRMATNSFILKGWTITLISILFSLAINTSNIMFVSLAIFPALIFWGLDAYYLKQERQFRKLYDYIRKNELEKDEYFSLDAKKFGKNVQSWYRTLFASTILPLHGVILLVIVFILFVKGGIVW